MPLKWEIPMNNSLKALLKFLVIGFVVLLLPLKATALITGVHGNRPVEKMGWPVGCEKVANLPGRLGYWEGPPFGGGEYHFLYRCKNTAEFNEALKVFATILIPGSIQRSATSRDGEITIDNRNQTLEIIVHDGPEYSFWLDNGNDNKESKEKSWVDWTFTVWRAENWHRLYNSPRSFFISDHPNFRQPVPPPQIDVYIGSGGSIIWKEVKLPPKIHVIDKREGYGPVKPVGGGMVRGEIYDMSNGQPIAGAKITIAGQKDRNDPEKVSIGITDAQGSFVIDKIPEGRYDILIRADGYASRKQGSFHNKGNTYHEFVVELIHEAGIKGIVTDPDGKPIKGVKVSARNTIGIDGLGYVCADAKSATTGEEGRFEIRSLPKGFTRIDCDAPTLHQETSISEMFDIPSDDDIKIIMTGTGIVCGKVVGRDGKPPTREFIAELEPIEGIRVGSWGGSMKCKKDGSFDFKGVPPGNYVIITKPNPMSEGEASAPKSVSVKVGETVEVEIINDAKERR